MNRIRPRVITERSLRSGRSLLSEPSSDAFMERLVKYIPSEIIGGYIVVSGFIEGLITSDKTFLHLDAVSWLWFVMVTFSILTFVYMLFAPRADGESVQWFQALTAPVAFLAWSFALGGPFEKTLSDYDKAGAAFLLVIVSLIIPAVDLAIDYFARHRSQDTPP